MNVCRQCLCGPIHHPRCPSPDTKVSDDDALNEAELSQKEYLKENLIPNKGPTYADTPEEGIRIKKTRVEKVTRKNRKGASPAGGSGDGRQPSALPAVAV